MGCAWLRVSRCKFYRYAEKHSVLGLILVSPCVTDLDDPNEKASGEKICHTNSVVFINPLSPNSDQDHFSPNNIHTLSTDKL